MGCGDRDVLTGTCVATLAGHSSWVWSVAVFPDGRHIVSASVDKTLKVWDVAAGACVATLEGHSSSVYGVAVFSDGRRIISGSGDGNLKLWGVAPVSVDLSKLVELRTLEGHSNWVRCGVHCTCVMICLRRRS